ncbi:MAG: hypothetical protein QOG88_1956 [Actinomycetota bacterium]|nr:hypothetical protein [Actinomycetota bacterium]
MMRGLRRALARILPTIMLTLVLVQPSRAASAATVACDGVFHQMASPAFGVRSQLYSPSALSPTDAWVSGTFTRADTDPSDRGFTMHFDGASWSKVRIDAPRKVEPYGLQAVSPTEAWIVGGAQLANGGSAGYAIERWNGSVWTRLSLPVNLSFVALAVRGTGSDLWVVGRNYAEGTGNANPIALHWDGSHWTVVPMALPPVAAEITVVFNDVAVISPTDAWAVGGSVGLSHVVVEHWDGSSWSLVSAPDPGDAAQLLGVTAVTASNVWATGQQDSIPLIEHWNGSVWTKVTAPSTSGNGNLFGVAAVSATDLWAVGSQWASPPPNPDTMAARSAGGAWTTVAAPDPVAGRSGLVDIAALPTGHVFAAGSIFSSPQTFIVEAC